MAIRYFIDLDCRPRRELGSEELLELHARLERAETIRRQFEEKYGATDETRMRFRERVVTASGETEKRETSVAELRGSCAELERLKAGCRQCPAAIDRVPYSCMHAISLPVSARAEQWLVDRVAPDGSRALELFSDACARNHYGELAIFRNWRRAGFLELPSAAESARGALRVTSEQVMNELLFVGDLMPSHVLGILFHLDALVATDGTRGDELMEMVEKVRESAELEDAPEIDFAIVPEESDDQSIRELKQFLFAAFRAFSLQCPLAIRL